VLAQQDPGNLEADIQAGAKTGFALLWWFLLVSMGCGTAFQLISGKLGLVTGKVGGMRLTCAAGWREMLRFPRGWQLWLWPVQVAKTGSHRHLSLASPPNTTHTVSACRPT
jgi:Mn2+/Fe2+ NRAMP family transporter